MKHRYTVALAATLTLLFATLRSEAATLQLGWNADGIANGALTDWDPDTNNTTATTVDWNGTGTKQSGSSNLGAVNDWINSPNYLLGEDTGTNDSWDSVLGDGPTDADASWELVFRPGDFTGTHTLFNTGGNGDGTAIVLIGSTLEFRFQDANDSDQRAVASFDISTLGGADEFFHVVALTDLDMPGDEGTASLYVNGIFRNAGSSDAGGGGINDWDGGDDAELGTGNNIPDGNPFNPDAFTGDIAIFNYYDGALLTPPEIAANYAALEPIPEPSAMLLAVLGVIGLGFMTRRRK